MEIRSKTLRISTRGRDQMIDLTGPIGEFLSENKIKNGLLTVFVPGSTASITTIEYEPGLVEDIKELGERIAPSDQTYAHDKTWGDGNGYSHLRASTIGPSLSIPIDHGKPTLGTWQQVVLIDHDTHPRDREVVLQALCA